MEQLLGEEFEKRYAQLNQEQKQAVDTIEGPVLVVAGPGSGKTELLSLRVANILQQTDVYPSSVLCLTFTESAAYNMRERLQNLIGTDANRVAIHTFHSFGADVIQQHPEYFYGPARFSGADELVQAEILENIFESLPHDNPLASTHPEQGYVYLRSVKSVISQLKQGGLSAKQLRSIVDEMKVDIAAVGSVVQEHMPARISKSAFADFEMMLSGFEALRSEPYSETIEAYAVVASRALKAALEEASGESTKPLTEWKKNWVETETVDGEKQFVCKDQKYVERLDAVVSVYEQYMEQLYNQGYYDFDDMLVDVVTALREHEGLRMQVQEQYQYVLVDEFQDTNDAQMQLLHVLADADVWEGKPNILAVGDDDQAIYKFQGANVKNIQSFTDWYPETQVITLNKNYRSTQPILDAAMHVIRQGDERLENMLEDVEKNLEAANPNLEHGDIDHVEFRTEEEEYYWVAQDIARKIAEGVPASEMAIITRKHAHLQEVVGYLQQAKVPFRYQKQLDVLSQPHVYQLIQLVRAIDSLRRKDRLASNELLVEVLSFPFWGIDRAQLWQLTLEWQKQKDAHWIELMQNHDNLKPLVEWFTQQAQDAAFTPLPEMLDRMLGAHEQMASESADEDEAREVMKGFSPFKQFYFNQKVLEERPHEYMQFLSALRVFVKSVQEVKKGQLVKLRDMLEFVDYHRKNGSGIFDTSVYASADESVELLTAHKAKGLEFEHVYVVGCTEEVWGSNRGNRNLLKFPKNMAHIGNESETRDDFLRLFYVAVTRAKTHLTMTLHTEKQFARAHQPLSFIHTSDSVVPDRRMQETSVETLTEDILSHAWEQVHLQPVEASEQALLQPVLERYQMSVTHLNNFLNIVDAGPQQFFLDNLLRFPQSMSESASFGTAMHATVQGLYMNLKNGEELTTEMAQELFADELGKQSVNKREFWLKKGNDALAVYMNERAEHFAADHEIERDFRSQEVRVGEARITGKIDKMIPLSKTEMQVVDFKTGKAVDSWTKGDASKYKVKLHNYKRQLVFYKLLVEGSADYRNFTVNTGALEFLEPKDEHIVVLEAEITQDEVERLKQLIEVVYTKILALDFPDTSSYDNTKIDGIIALEDDLLAGSI